MKSKVIIYCCSSKVLLCVVIFQAIDCKFSYPLQLLFVNSMAGSGGAEMLFYYFYTYCINFVVHSCVKSKVRSCCASKLNDQGTDVTFSCSLVLEFMMVLSRLTLGLKLQLKFVVIC